MKRATSSQIYELCSRSGNTVPVIEKVYSSVYRKSTGSLSVADCRSICRFALRDISMATLQAGSEHYHKNMVVKSGKKVQRNI